MKTSKERPAQINKYIVLSVFLVFAITAFLIGGNKVPRSELRLADIAGCYAVPIQQDVQIASRHAVERVNDRRTITLMDSENANANASLHNSPADSYSKPLDFNDSGSTMKALHIKLKAAICGQIGGQGVPPPKLPVVEVSPAVNNASIHLRESPAVSSWSSINPDFHFSTSSCGNGEGFEYERSAGFESSNQHCLIQRYIYEYY
jgi:hypothetical protein